MLSQGIAHGSLWDRSRCAFTGHSTLQPQALAARAHLWKTPSGPFSLCSGVTMQPLSPLGKVTLFAFCPKTSPSSESDSFPRKGQEVIV